VYGIFDSIGDEFMRNAKIILSGREREQFGKLSVDGMATLKWIINKF
jgi:hypothetical protein